MPTNIFLLHALQILAAYSFLKSSLFFSFHHELYLQEDPVAKLVLVPEVGGGGAGVQELVRHVVPRHVREPEVPLHVHRQPGRVDRLQRTVRTLEHTKTRQ